MNPDFQKLMSDAARLTQGGDLAAATAMIQRALNGGGASQNGVAAHDVIDVPARRVADNGDSVGSIAAPDADGQRRSDEARREEPAAPQAGARASTLPAFSGGANPLAAFMPAFDPQARGALNGNGGGNGGELLSQLMSAFNGAGLAGASDDDASDADETAVLDDAQAEAPAKEADVASQRDRFIAGSFGNRRVGRRSWKLYVPPQAATGQQLPLVVMLHGCTQDPDDFARGTAMNEAARAQGFYVLYPAQSQKMNPQRCWNWFKHNHQQRGRGEPALIAAMVRDIGARYDDIDPSRVYVAGLSAGGAMAAILGAAYPDLFAAVGVHSGLAVGAAHDLPSALAAMQSGAAAGSPAHAASGVPTIVFHGDADHTVNVKNAEQLLAASVGAAAAAALVPETVAATGKHTRGAMRRVHRNAQGAVDAELWIVQGAPHAWSGGDTGGSFTDAAGPDASAEMLRFFQQHRLPKPD